jgi:hypothetical protein
MPRYNNSWRSEQSLGVKLGQNLNQITHINDETANNPGGIF